MTKTLEKGLGQQYRIFMPPEAGVRTSRAIPASPTKVKEYLLELLSTGQPMKREELISRARLLAPRDGFMLDTSTAARTVKKALKLLLDEGAVESPRIGWWRLITNGPNQSTNEESGAADDIEDATLDEAEPRVAIKREIGNGPESVYIYYHDAYAELARAKGLTIWECKVGSTLGEPDARVIGQGALTAFPRAPIIGLVIRTENGRALERALHTALTLAGARIEHGGGSEWFVTSPEIIEHWVQEFWKSLSILKSES